MLREERSLNYADHRLEPWPRPRAWRVGPAIRKSGKRCQGSGTSSRWAVENARAPSGPTSRKIAQLLGVNRGPVTSRPRIGRSLARFLTGQAPCPLGRTIRQRGPHLPRTPSSIPHRMSLRPPGHVGLARELSLPLPTRWRWEGLTPRELMHPLLGDTEQGCNVHLAQELSHGGNPRLWRREAGPREGGSWSRHG